MEPDIYFRSLYSVEHIVDWVKREFTSFHHGQTPDEWLGALKDGKKSRDDYSLETKNGVYLPSARDTYFENCVRGGKPWNELDDETQKAATELFGVCAFDNDNKAAAYWYGGKSEVCRVVAFYGVAVFKLGSESYGGVIAAVVKPIGGLMTPEEFVVRWCNGVKPLKPQGMPEDRDEEPNLSDEGADEYDEMPEIR